MSADYHAHKADMALDRVEEALSYAARKMGVLSLNDEQKKAVKAIVDKNDIFVCLPTGFGKSLCFQSVPFAMDYLDTDSSVESVVDRHLAIVVEPTAAIMREQVAKLTSRGISAAFINHEQNDLGVKKMVVDGKVKFIYISPESLTMPKYRDMLLTDRYQKNLAVFAIDEVHCMLTWSNFRHQFELLNEVRAVVDCPVVALTATCTMDARDTITTQLCMERAVYVSHSADRPNIFLSTQLMPAKIEDWSPYLDEDITIVQTLGVNAERKVYFCRTIEMACRLYEYYEDVLGDCAYLDPKGKVVPSNRIIAMYHSQSAESVKRAVCESLVDPNGIVRRVFATQSLSMGIDCLNIRQVIHWEVPRTLEAYFQEVGRAGRDGLPAVAVLLYSKGMTFCSPSIQDFCANPNSDCLRVKVLNYFSISFDKENFLENCCSVCSCK